MYPRAYVFPHSTGVGQCGRTVVLNGTVEIALFTELSFFAKILHQRLAIEDSSKFVGVVTTVETVATDKKTLLHLGQRLLDFAHQYIGDVDLCHDYP